MKELYKGHEAEISVFTDHQVDTLAQTEGFNQNHLAKVLLGHCETYQCVIKNLLPETLN